MSDLFDLTGKNAVVLGGAGGIGKGIARVLAEQGADVSICSRRLEALEAAAKDIEAACGKKIGFYAVDCTSETDMNALAERYIADHGHVDILVNSQGLNKKFPFLEHPLDEWDAMFAVNVRGTMLACKAFGKYMVEQKSGRIINISSIGATLTHPTDISVCYGATKGAVNALTLNLAAGWAQHGITVNAIAPIMTETEMIRPMLEKDPGMRKYFAERVPLGRMGLPEDCAYLAVYLASEAGRFITGQVISPDGGLQIIQ